MVSKGKLLSAPVRKQLDDAEQSEEVERNVLAAEIRRLKARIHIHNIQSWERVAASYMEHHAMLAMRRQLRCSLWQQWSRPIQAWGRLAHNETQRRRRSMFTEARVWLKETKWRADAWRRFVMVKLSKRLACQLLRAYRNDLDISHDNHTSSRRRLVSGIVREVVYKTKYENLQKAYAKLEMQFKQSLEQSYSWSSLSVEITDSLAELADEKDDAFATGLRNADLPQYWGISLSQLLSLHDRTKCELDAYCRSHRFYRQGANVVHVCRHDPCAFDHAGVEYRSHQQALTTVPLHLTQDLMDLTPNMHAVVSRFVKPETRDTNTSYALMLNPGGLLATVFVTHTWGDIFHDFINALRRSVLPTDAMWVCSFALPQNDMSAITDMLAKAELNDVPFARALKACLRHVVIIDDCVDVVKRAWCLYEIEKGSTWGIPTLYASSSKATFIELNEQVQSLDARSATCSLQEDQERVMGAIDKELGFDVLNSHLHRCIRGKMQCILNGTDDDNTMRSASLTARTLQSEPDEELREKQRNLALDSNAALFKQLTQDRQAVSARVLDIQAKLRKFTKFEQDNDEISKLEQQLSKEEFDMRDIDMQLLANQRENYLLEMQQTRESNKSAEADGVKDLEKAISTVGSQMEACCNRMERMMQRHVVQSGNASGTNVLGKSLLSICRPREVSN